MLLEELIKDIVILGSLAELGFLVDILVEGLRKVVRMNPLLGSGGPENEGGVVLAPDVLIERRRELGVTKQPVFGLSDYKEKKMIEEDEK